MSVIAFRQVSVWLDENAPQRGAFRQGLEWASRLSLPLRAIVPLEKQWRSLTPENRGKLETGNRKRQTERAIQADLLASCKEACERASVPWEYSQWQGPVSRCIGEFLLPTSLCVFSSALTDSVKGELLRGSLHGRACPALVCPQVPQSIGRVLVLHQASTAVDSFLDTVARLCGVLKVAPVVLTVARHERAALARQRAAQAIWAAQGLHADFDILIGCEVRTAVASVVRWRRCSHIIVERHHASPWWRWLRRDTLGRLLGLSDSYSFLALPAEMSDVGAWAAAPNYSQSSIVQQAK